MDQADLTTLVEAGKELLTVKLFMTGVNFLWVYDYLLTLGDEIQYGWSGRKSWVFALFIANRYLPILQLVCINVLQLSHTQSVFTLVASCEQSKWLVILYAAAVTCFAQIAVTLRVYAVTGRNKLLGGALSVIVAAQLCFGIYFTIGASRNPLEPLPEINLDAFNFCGYKRWRLAELISANITIAFDIFAFLIILITAKRQRQNRHPGISSIFDAILREATLYFVFMFASQILFEIFLFFAPEDIQIMPGVLQPIFVPVMASRLMLSLKKTAAEPRGTRAVPTMTGFSMGRPPGDGSFHSIPPEDVELEVAPRLPHDRGSRQVS